MSNKNTDDKDLKKTASSTRRVQDSPRNPTNPPISSGSLQQPKPVSVSSFYIEDDAYSIKNEISQYLDQIDSVEDLSHYPGAERSEFDFASERRNVYTTNIFEAAGHLIKGMLGVGILSMHEAYMNGGTLTGLATTCVLGFIGPYNTLMLVRQAQRRYQRLRISKMTYPDLMEAAVAVGPHCLRKYRKCFRYTVDAFLIVELCSSCNVYQIMMAHTMKKVMVVTSLADLHIRIYVLIVTIPLLMLCAIKRLKPLAWLAIVGDFFIVICVCIALYFTFQELPSLSERYMWKSFHGLFSFCGILVYSIDCITLALPVENNMSRPRFFPIVAYFAISIVLVCCTLIGFFGYWKWGEDCISPIILHLPFTVGAIILYVLFAIVLAVTFSVQFWIPFKIIWRYHKKRVKRRRGFCEIISRLLLVLVITVISLIFPDVRKFIGLIGNIFLGFITFIFPPIIEYFITYRDYTACWKRMLNLASLILGFAMVGGGFYIVFVPKPNASFA